MRLRVLGTNVVMMLFTVAHASSDPYLDILKDELNREMEILSKQDPPVYHINYRVDYDKYWVVRSDFGNLTSSQADSSASLTADLRVGDKSFDNTHLSKGEADNTRNNYSAIAYDLNPVAVKQILWRVTDDVYRSARAEYISKKNKISVENDEKYDDYSPGVADTYFEESESYLFTQEQQEMLAEKLKEASAVFPQNTDMMSGMAVFRFNIKRKYYVSTDGDAIVQNFVQAQIVLSGSVRTPEGDPENLYQVFHARFPEDLPSADVIKKEAVDMVQKLMALKDAPLAEPYSGPAILSPRASGVFFHEILGHRVEGHRLKDDTDSHTFKLKINKQVLPKSMSVTFDPSLDHFDGNYLSGHYVYDDEGTKAQTIKVIENGILKDFLMSNTPVSGFPQSNGHGRAQAGLSPISRQSNLLVSTKQPYTEDELRKMLIKQCKKEKKPYGYYFKDVQGGFTMNKRYIPNAFNVTPTEVYRVYADGRPDELVRGVRLIGTPLAMFSNIEAASDEYGIFNGVCGASSGSVPVSAISPAIFVTKIETQKSDQYFSTGPILESPQTIDNK